MSFGQKENAFETEVQQIASTSGIQNIPDITPVDFAKVTKVVLYGGIIDPATSQKRNHTGIDFEIAKGSNVFLPQPMGLWYTRDTVRNAETMC